MADHFSESTDLYKVLGVDRHAGEEVLKRAYKSKLVCLHPERNRGESDEVLAANEYEFEIVQIAYQILRDAERRTAFDQDGIDGVRKVECLRKVSGNTIDDPVKLAPCKRFHPTSWLSMSFLTFSGFNSEHNLIRMIF